MNIREYKGLVKNEKKKINIGDERQNKFMS